MTDCCAQDWRVEVLNLTTGTRRSYLTPSSLSFDQTLNTVGAGSVTLPVRSTRLANVWPHLTSVACLRINGPGASPIQPVCEFLGMVEQIGGSSSGGINLGLTSIEGYLSHRIIQDELPPLAGATVFTEKQQAVIAAALVAMGQDNGVPLSAVVSQPSVVERSMRYLDTDRKYIMDALLELTALEDGPDYRLVHEQQSNLAWRTVMTFADYIGNTEPYQLHSQRGMSDYGIDVDATMHANRVIGIGNTDRRVYDADGSEGSMYPLFERSAAWTDARDSDQLEALTKGELANYDHPTTVPSITLSGLDIAPNLNPGDTLDLRLDHGAIQYDGLARLISKSWSSDADSPTKVTLNMVPQGDTNDDILAVVPGLPECC